MALRASSMLMHLEAIRAGTGRGVLPCYVGLGADGCARTKVALLVLVARRMSAWRDRRPSCFKDLPYYCRFPRIKIACQQVRGAYRSSASRSRTEFVPQSRCVLVRL